MDSVSDISQFIGRFHLVLLHLPIGLLAALAFLELLAFKPEWRQARSGNPFLLVLALPAALGTAACGWLLGESGGYDERLLFLHRWTGVAVTVVVCLMSIAHWRGRPSLYRILAFAAVPLIVVTGHFGGSLTHGSGYFTRHAPSWLGGGADAGPTTAGGTAAFAAVEPILSEYCYSCHGPEKSKSGLRVDSAELLLEGGDSGPALIAGDADESLVIVRIVLPLEHDDHMPPGGRPQPSVEEVARLRDWILAGASP